MTAADGDGLWTLPGASQPQLAGGGNGDGDGRPGMGRSRSKTSGPELIQSRSFPSAGKTRTRAQKTLTRTQTALYMVTTLKSSVRIQRGLKSDFDIELARSQTEKRAVVAAKDFHMKEDPTRPVHSTFAGHTGRVEACCVFAGGEKLLTCADDNTIRIFNVKSGECETTLGCDTSELLEHRGEFKGFPDVLGPFGIQETTLRPKMNFADLTYEIDVAQAADFKERGQLSKELWTALMTADGLQGRLTEPHPITLTAEERAPYGIPLRATHFAWGKQVQGADSLSSEQVLELGVISAEASFAVNGGFVYVNAEGRGEDWTSWTSTGGVEKNLEVQANAVCTTGLATLHFTEQIAVDMELRASSLKKLREENRFSRVTLVPLRMHGARYYTWIFPGEDLGAVDGESWVPAAGGGFMYLMSEKDDPTREECTKCCLYQHTTGHNNWVQSCCVLTSAGEREVLSCSADRTMRVWDIATRCNTKIMAGHTSRVWDCCEFKSFSGEYRALSVSSDMTMRVWDLKTALEITKLRMTGHSDWVLACCAFTDNGKPKALSSSRDHQLRLWNPDTGSCIRVLCGHGDAVLKCEVYSDQGTWKAVSCSEDASIKIWDVSENAVGTDCLTTIVGHDNKVSSCVPFYDDQLETWVGVSCSADSTIRVWDLRSGTLERKMVDPDKDQLCGCAVTADGSKIFACSGTAIRVWDLDLLRGVDRFTDVQSITQTGEQLWKWWSHMADDHHKAWAHLLVDTMLAEQQTMAILYGRDHDGLTLLHRLAREPDGGIVMQFLLNHYRVGRELAMVGKVGVMSREDVAQAEKTIGLIVRAGKSHGRSLLGMAMHTADSKSATIIRVLLEDYCEMTQAVKLDSFSQQVVARYSVFEPISEADLVDLFQEDKFPLDAAAFVERLPLRITDGLNSQPYLEEEIHKDSLGSQGMMVRATTQMQPVHPERPWWDNIIDEVTSSVSVLSAIKGIVFCRMCRRTIRKVTAVETSLVPIVAASPQAESSNRCKDFCERTVCTGCSQARKRASTIDLPFTRLLEECWDYARQYSRVELFESPCLKAIVHHKWGSSCRFIFLVSFARVLSFTMLLTVVIVNNGANTNGTLFYDIARWYCVGLDILMIKYALHEFFTHGLVGFLGDSRNWIESYITVASLISLIRLESPSREHFSVPSLLSGSDDGSEGNSGRYGALQAILLLLAWGQLAKWLQGFESLFFTMEVVTQNVRTLADFLVILMVVILAYSLAFYLLMRGSTGAYTDMQPPETCFSWSCEKLTALHEDTFDDYTLDGVIGSFIQVFAMMQGEFSTQVYEKPWRDELKKGFFTLDGSLLYVLFGTFMLFVPIVMVNVLIASMQQSYDRVYANKEGYMLMERAHLILRLETLVMIESSPKPPDTSFLGAFSRLVQVLCGFKIRGDQQTAGTYLHVLSSVESGMCKRPDSDDQTAGGSGHDHALTSNDELEQLKQRNRDLMDANRALSKEVVALTTLAET